MNMNFASKNVLVTGASRGIGLAIARKFAQLGANVYGTYVKSSETAKKVEDDARQAGLRLTLVRADVRNQDEANQLVKRILDESGTLDVLVNNAGVTNDKLLLQMEKDDFTDVVETNLYGSFYLMRAVMPNMMRKRNGAIVNISSIIATRPGKGQTNYSASKGALESLTKSLAQEVGSKNIRVNAIAPGMVETDMSQEIRGVAGDEILSRIALKRFGQPDDIANVAVFLASDLASFVTGQVWHVDGGA